MSATATNPLLFQPTQLAAALKHILALEIIGTDAIKAADDALASFEKATGPDRFTLLGTDGQPLTGTIAATQVVAIHDALTGLTWQAVSSTKRYTNDGAADEYAKSLTTLGYTDWRVANELELLSIRDESTCNPAVLPPFRAGVKPAYHWSSSPDPESAVCARGVSFNYGYSDFDHRYVGYHVLACRGGLGAVGGVSPGQ